MAQPSSEGSFVVVSLTPDGDKFRIRLRDSGRVGDFVLRMEDMDGIRLLTGTERMTWWLAEGGKLWGLQAVYAVVDAVSKGEELSLPMELLHNT